MRLLPVPLVLLALACAPSVPDGAAGALAERCEAITVPAMLGRVSDHAGMLTPADESRLAARLADFTSRSGHQAVVVTVETLAGQSVETAATCIGNRWGIGDAARDDGIVILLAERERQSRIALGLGLSADAADPRAAEAIAATTGPFGRGDFAGGLENGIAVLERRFP